MSSPWDAEEGKKRGLDGEREREREREKERADLQNPQQPILHSGEGNHERARIFCERPIFQKNVTLDFCGTFFESSMSPFSSPESITFSQHLFLGLRQTISVAILPLQSTGRSIDGMGILAELSLRSLGLLGAILICLSASAARVFIF